MGIIIGSARIDERGKASGGSAGDQTGNEVSTQSFYMHSKGWYILRPKSTDVANKLAKLMQDACNNNNIGYDQGNRDGVITHGIYTKTKTECDCSTLVRECVREAGISLGNITTANEASALVNTGQFTKYNCSGSGDVYNGDILVTKTKGHTVIVVSGRPRTGTTSSSANQSVTDVAKRVINGEFGNGDTRKQKVEALGFNYETVRAEVNRLLGGGSSSSGTSYYSKYTGSSSRLDDILKSIGVPSSYYGNWSKRKPIASANGISGYTGSASQNSKLITLAKQGKLKKV